MSNPIQKFLRLITSKPESNPPIWPDNENSKVIVVDEEYCKDPANVTFLQQQVSDPYNSNSKNVVTPGAVQNGTFTSAYHFSSRRRAVLFAPGTYELDLEVGYYSQVLGTGSSASDVLFQDVKDQSGTVLEPRNGIFVPALDRDVAAWGLCLNTFWRAAENFSSNVSGYSSQYAGLQQPQGLQWGVSQAAPLRRVHAKSGLSLGDGGAQSSGGFMANIVVDGETAESAQQQFFHRNVAFNGPVTHGAWSLTFLGCTGSGAPKCDTSKTDDAPAVTVVGIPQVRMEKPYIVLKSDKKGFALHVPKPLFGPANTVGPQLDAKNDEVRDFSRVRVVRSDEADPTFRIQEALDEGKDVVLAAGIFNLTSTITIKESRRVILGIGMATVVQPPDGSPCIKVRPGLRGVRLAGLTLEASERNADPYVGVSCLLEWGEGDTKDAGSPESPGGIFDLFCRVGGDVIGDRTKIQVDCMVRLLSGNIIGDNLWLWRADHAKLQGDEQPNYPNISKQYWQTEENEFRVNRAGLEVYGDDVTIYGLAVEHANTNQTVWMGDRGTVVFYQCELPYGVSQSSFGTPGYCGYLVQGNNISQHTVYAPGVYSNFRNNEVNVENAIQTNVPDQVPVSFGTVVKQSNEDAPAINIINPFTVWLDNNFGIEHIVNGLGDKTRHSVPVFLDNDGSNANQTSATKTFPASSFVDHSRP